MTDLRPVPHPAADAAPRTAAPLSDAERTVLSALRELQYGELEVVVHGARIVQITRRQKLRVDASPSA